MRPKSQESSCSNVMHSASNRKHMKSIKRKILICSNVPYACSNFIRLIKLLSLRATRSITSTKSVEWNGSQSKQIVHCADLTLKSRSINSWKETVMPTQILHDEHSITRLATKALQLMDKTRMGSSRSK